MSFHDSLPKMRELLDFSRIFNPLHGKALDRKMIPRWRLVATQRHLGIISLAFEYLFWTVNFACR